MKSRVFSSVFSGVFLIAMILGCAHMRPLTTPSGKPEVTITNCSKKEVVDAIVNMMVGAGFEVKDVSDYHAVFGKLSDSFGDALLYGSKYDSTPEYRVKYSFTETEDGVRVIAAVQVVTNPGSAFERVNDRTTGKDARDMQSLLERFKVGLELSKRGKTGIMVDQNGVITKVMEGGGAADAGLQTDDRIIKIDGQEAPVGDANKLAFMITGEAGTYVEITVVRNGEEVTAKVLRK